MKLSEVDKDLVARLRHKNGPASMGGDPEFFIANKRGKILNADAFLPSKHKPLAVPAKSKMMSKLFFDGIQAEMAVAYSTCREWFADNIRDCWRRVIREIPKDHKIVLKPSAKIRRSVINGADPEARIFGCAPDFNVYTMSTNTEPMDASRHPYRYAGGHLHIGLHDIDYRKEQPHDLYYPLVSKPENHVRVIKAFDLLVSIPTLLLDNGPGSRRRRAKYGKAGCFRPTPYGVEYRTPSCWWLKSPATVSIIYGLARLAWTIVANDEDINLVKAIKVDEDMVRGCINESDVKTVQKIWEDLRPYVALISYPFTNPLNIAGVRTDKFEYLKENYLGYKKPSLKGKPVYCLAAFEYMLKNGSEVLIDRNILNEWGLADGTAIYNGFANESYSKLVNNKDFQKFQSDFLNNFFV